MKKFGKLLAFVTVAGAAVAGLWYFLDNTKVYEEDDFEDEDADDEVKEEEERAYVSLDPVVADEDKAALEKAVTSAVKESIAKAEETADGVGVVKEDVEKKVSGFEFKSLEDEE